MRTHGPVQQRFLPWGSLLQRPRGGGDGVTLRPPVGGLMAPVPCGPQRSTPGRRSHGGPGTLWEGLDPRLRVVRVLAGRGGGPLTLPPVRHRHLLGNEAPPLPGKDLDLLPPQCLPHIHPSIHQASTLRPALGTQQLGSHSPHIPSLGRQRIRKTVNHISKEMKEPKCTSVGGVADT